MVAGRWKGTAPCGRTAFGNSILEMSPHLGQDGGRNCTLWNSKKVSVPVCGAVTLATGKGPPESLVWAPLSTLYFGFKLLEASSLSLPQALTSCKALLAGYCAMSPGSNTAGASVAVEGLPIRVLRLNPHHEVNIFHQGLRSLAAESHGHQRGTDHTKRKNRHKITPSNAETCAEHSEKHSIQMARVQTHKRHPVHSHHAYPSHSTGHFVVGLLLGAQILDALHALLQLGCSSIFLLLPLHWLRVTKRFSWSLCTFCSLPSAAVWALLPAVGHAFLPPAVGSALMPALHSPAVEYALPCLLLAVLFLACCWPCPALFAVVPSLSSSATLWQFTAPWWPPTPLRGSSSSFGSRQVLSVQGRIVTTSRSAGSVRLVLVACLRAAVSCDRVCGFC